MKQTTALCLGLLCISLSAHADNVCKQTDANGVVSFIDCGNASPGAEMIDASPENIVNAPPAVEVMNNGLQGASDDNDDGDDDSDNNGDNNDGNDAVYYDGPIVDGEYANPRAVDRAVDRAEDTVHPEAREREMDDVRGGERLRR